MSNRPKIPAGIRRRLLIECGYRCAVPTCRYPLLENAHIDSWSKTKNHNFENLICLCPNCHTMYDNRTITREAIIHYKRQLGFLNELYTKFEIDTLDYLKSEKRAVLPSKLLIKRLLDENLVSIEEVMGYNTFHDGKSEPFLFSIMLTDQGKQLIREWIASEKFLSET